MRNYLKPLVSKKEATAKMNQHLHSNLWKKIKRSDELTSMEQIHLPFWCFTYEAFAYTVPNGMKGRIAIEPLSGMNAILPVDYKIDTTERVLPSVQRSLDMEAAKEVIYWELFTKEKRREKITVTIKDRWLVYVPYWIGYIRNRDYMYDIIAVDALNGKIDIPMKDTVLSYLCKESTGNTAF